jgi:diadenylate cyclase
MSYYFFGLDLSLLNFIRLEDLLDILIVWYVIYKIMVWIKNTRAWVLFKGLILILSIFLISSVFKLSALYFIISQTFSVGLIAAIVLFQPELRKALEHLGNKDFLKINIDSQEDNKRLKNKYVLEIISALKFLAKCKTGALIILTKEIALGELEQSGIFLDAYISQELLKNIFVDKTALHDGAVIIRDNKIKAAACILPLTQNNNNLDHDLGTRHRAALGTSEISDAYIFIVSEERGEISLAKNGKLFLNLDDKSIKNYFNSFNQKSGLRLKYKIKNQK